jgi:hypothetical protein
MAIIKFDRHARRRMKWRNITEEEIIATVNKPDTIEASIMGRTNVYKLLDDRNIKVTYRPISDGILIISAVDKGKRGSR